MHFPTRILRFPIIFILATCVLPLIASASSASTQKITLSGTVTCVPHNVEGVWIEVGNGGSGSGSGWANMAAKANTTVSTTYTRTFTAPLPANIRLHVGCGGTPQKWWSDNRTPSSSRVFGAINGSRSGVNARCNDGSTAFWGTAGPPTSDNMRCSWGTYPGASAICMHTGSATGTCADYDWGYRSGNGWNLLSSGGFGYRNCTDYAAWRVGSLTWSSFHFPTGLGNATDWSKSPYYKNAGFTESHTPQLGDLAVWTGTKANPDGHVAVVVTLNPTVVEDYNYAGTGLDALRKINSANAPTWYLHR